MAKVDYYIIATDYAWIKPGYETITWQPSALETYSEADWWNAAMKVWGRSVKPRTAKVV